MYSILQYNPHLEEHRLIKAQLYTLNVNSVSGDGDTIPASAHSTVGTSPGLLQTPLLRLSSTGSDSRLLEDGSQSLSSIHTITQHLILGVLTSLA